MFQPYMREMNLAVKWENEALRLRAALVALRDRHREFGVFDLVMLEKVLADG